MSRAEATTATEITRAPIQAGQAGAMPRPDPTKKATTSTAITATTNQPRASTVRAGASGGPTATAGTGSVASRFPASSTQVMRAPATRHGRASRAENPAYERPLWWMTSRLVRLATGDSSDAPLARKTVASSAASTVGRPRPRTARTTTGVNSTTVASRLRTDVMTTASTATATTVRRCPARPCRRPRPSSEPAASNSPAASAPSATTKMAARNASVGHSARTCCHAADHGSRPVTSTRAAAGTAHTHSGHGLGGRVIR